MDRLHFKECSFLKGNFKKGFPIEQEKQKERKRASFREIEDLARRKSAACANNKCVLFISLNHSLPFSRAAHR